MRDSGITKPKICITLMESMNISFLRKGDHYFPILKVGNEKRILKENVDLNNFYANINHYTKLYEELEPVDIEPGTIPVYPGKILCPSLNFMTHSAETKQKVPEYPYFFTKFRDTITGWNSHILKHREMRQLDYEGEIAAIIGKKIKSADEKTAEESICALAVVNDVSARDYQEQISPPFGKNWVMGKAADSFLPISSWIKLYEGDPVEFTTEVNGEIRQKGNTKDMIFPFRKLISYVNKFVTLYPGDMILSGTPDGVAKSGKYPYLKNGDTVKVQSSGIGYIENVVTEFDS